MSGRTRPRIAVLLGGPSAERDVSLVSGAECSAALRAEGYEVIEIDAGDDLVDRLKASGADIAFNALHGRWGEDGAVQGILEWHGIPYTHSGILASSLAMDKVKAKGVFARAGLQIAESRLVDAAIARETHPMEPPYVVKPYNEGSSVGVHVILEGANSPAQLAQNAPEKVMVERYIPGRELTVAVMGDRPLTVTDIFSNGWYDYEAKYSEGGSTHVCPADVPRAVFDLAMTSALTAHEALGCRGVSRTDFRWDETKGPDGLIVLETNTQPGMTPTSLVPEQAAAVGISFAQLLNWMIEDASTDR